MIFKTKKFTDDAIIRNETLFTTANGYLGLRGDTEEKDAAYHKGTYINGFFDKEPIQYGEAAYGYAENHETILNLPDPKCIELAVNGIHFSTGKPDDIHDFSLAIDTTTGILTRSLFWNTPDGNRIELSAERIVSFMHPKCAFIKYTVKNAGPADVRIEIVSSIDMSAHNIMAREDPRVGAKFSSRPLIVDEDTAEGETLCFSAHTRNSGLSLAGTVQTAISDSGAADYTITAAKNCSGGITYTAGLEPGACFTLQKFITYSHDKTEAAQDLKNTVLSENRRFAELGEQKIKAEQVSFLSQFWDVADITIDGDKNNEEALKFNLFQLLQSVGKDGKSSIAAKGLTGEGYEGHFFWDTEAYICPVFTYTAPEIAENLLKYRYSILPKAKERAKIMNLKGVLYPWRTIDGEETSAYYPAGTAQYHIDADILFALNKVLCAEGKCRDSGTKNETGLTSSQIEEMAAETARMWVSLGFYNEHQGGKFCINDVTGPDEYTAIVNNNTFTNLMAAENLYISCRLAGSHADEKEKTEWKHAADMMYIPFDKKLGIYPQDDSFLDKEPWDFKNTPKENYPLLLHYHPLVIYRHRVLKQADTVLAQFLLPERFSRAEKIRNFDFYEPYTTGDSSLSHCIQSIMASETGDSEKALDYFNKTVRMDIDDVNGNVKDGIHTACMAGSWMAVIYGFAGFRDYNSHWSFNPQLPEKWERLSFSMKLEGTTIGFEFTHDKAVYTLRQSGKQDSILLIHRNKPFTLTPAEPQKIFTVQPQLRAVLFDLDGVITDTAEFHYKAWKILAEKNSLRFNREINKQLLGVSREDSLAIILRENNTAWDENRKTAACREKNELYLKSLDTLTPDDILPGIGKLLAELKAAGIKTGLASASKNAPKVLRQLKLENMFTAVADAAAVQMSKPEPDIFLAAAEQCGEWYSDCIGIEDAEAGITAISKAGMKSVGVCTRSQLNAATTRVKSTSEITLKLLRQTIAC